MVFIAGHLGSNDLRMGLACSYHYFVPQASQFKRIVMFQMILIVLMQCILYKITANSPSLDGLDYTFDPPI